jgi:hypothetical protein
MPCPECGGRTDVYDSRLNTQKLIRRRRECRACGFRFATIEIANEYQPLGRKEKPNAPIPVPPPAARQKPGPKPRVVATVARHKPVRVRDDDMPRSFADDIVPWSEDSEDFSSYVDIPRGFNDD